MQILKRRLSALLFFVVLTNIHFFQAAYADIAEGSNYLAIQQQLNGSFVGNSAISTDFQSSAETIRSLNFISESNSVDIPSARTFLATDQSRNTENLSRLIILASQAADDTQSLVIELLQHQSADGGFGDFEGYDSTVLDTAFALEAIAESGQQPASVVSAVSFLLNSQSTEGSWADGVNESSTYLTALSMRALWHYRSVFGNVFSAVNKAQDYLLSIRNESTGLWSETHESALALIAIIPNISEFSQVEAIVADLRNQQLGDGSWDNDVYTTALAIRALASQPIPLPAALTTGGIIGTVLNDNTRQPIANATIAIDSLSVSVTTDASGVFSLQNLDPATYDLSVNGAGYVPVTFNSVNVIVGVDTSIGDVLLSSLPTTGVLQGQITDAATTQGLSGVSISVAGVSTESATTASDGSYSFVGLNPGAITVTIAKDGYQPLTASASIAAGGTLVLSPAMVSTSSGTEPLPGTPTTGDLRGVVTDSVTGEPIPSASIRVRNATTNASLKFAQTAVDGSYEISEIEAVDIVITVNRSGYLQATASTTVIAGNALVFSPGIVPVGGDPDSGSGGDIGSEPLPGTATTGLLRGVATDVETSLPLVGVSINVTGAITASTVTAADGTYSVADIPPGDVTVVASINDYLSVTAAGTVAAGNVLVFDPALTPLGFVGGTPGSIIGSVVDATTQNVVRYATVRVAGGVEEVTASTGFSGNFELNDLVPGNYNVSFERSGYASRNFDVVITSGNTIDFQVIELNKVFNQVAVYGQLTDLESDEPIANAVVNVSGTSISTQTDEQGNYRLNDLGTGTKTLVFAATAYNSQTLIFTFPQGGEYEVNRGLGLASSSNIDITFLGTDQSSYNAYAPVNIQTSILNNANPITAMVTYTLFNEQDELVSEYQGTLPGSTDLQIDFANASVTNVEATFNTANLAPGDYRIIGRIVLGDQMVGPATVILDERVTEFTIETTRRVSELTVDALPAFSAVGVTENINLLATVLNRSNVATTTFIRYQLRDSSGSLLRSSGTIAIPLPVESDSVVLTNTFIQEFLSAGEHVLNVNYAGSTNPEVINGDTIIVAPGLRVDAIQSVTPETVTPDEDKRVRINIRLEGKEVQ